MSNSDPPQAKAKAPHTDFQILMFIIALCFTCAFLLSVIAYVLHGPQQEAKEFDQSKQMLIAAKILSADDTFEILKDSTTIGASFDPSQEILVAVDEPAQAPKTSDADIKAISEQRIRPLLTDSEGKVYTFEEKGLTLSEYLSDNERTGYANLPLKLFYAILPNESEAKDITAEEVAKDLSQVYAIVIPVSGFGLWAPIYGYLAVAPNGEDVIGTTWYDQAETPGLGANISYPTWQKQFFGKLVFQPSPEGGVDLETAEMGILVVKGKVSDVYGDRPISKSAVDGISGATLTGEGVTAAYRDSLTPYRAFLINLNKESGQKEENG
ncbi:MAG: NADH:ubiquinone reductase (Na(+)-transporting) subunit C [Chlamydiales bacterium]